MLNQDFSKMFDMQQMQKNMQQMGQQWQQMLSTNPSMGNNLSSNMETMKQVGSLWAETLSKCTEAQTQYCQSSMADCIGAMKELASAKGMEEYLQKQTELSQKAAEKAQTTAQELASQLQKTQTQCTDLISQAVMSGMSWNKANTSSK